MEERENNAVEKVERIESETVAENTGYRDINRAEEIRREIAELRAEKEEKAEKERIEKARAKYNEQREKEDRKADYLREKRERKQRLNDMRRKDNKGGYIVAVITLSIASFLLALGLTLSLVLPSETDRTVAAGYERSFYDAVSQVDNMDLNLSKVLATGDETAQQKYLVNLAVLSEVAENDIQQLPLQDENKHYTTKLINQIGDYAKYLNEKLIDGGSISSEEKKSLAKLYEANLQLKQSLQKMREEMGDDFDFNAVKNKGSKNPVLSGFNELQNLSVEYPELIYDGPFSDGRDAREIKGLPEREVSKEEAEQIFTAIFNDYGLTDIEFAGESKGLYETYNFSAKTDDGNELFAQITKRGGKLIMFNDFSDCKEIKYSRDEVVKIAEKFLEDLGLKDMKAVWVNENSAVASINFAYYYDGEVVVYPDLIKVNVCQERGIVSGLEASGYYLNHIDRKLLLPKLNAEEAMGKVSADIDIETYRLAVIPLREESETLAYEFMGKKDGSTYYVYIDAVSGRQAEMFKVIESTEGTLLL